MPTDVTRFFDLSFDLLCIADLNGFFTRVNPAWSRTLGWTTRELLAKPYLDFVHADDREQTLREAAGLARGATTVSFENRYQCKDGSYKWLQWTAVPYAGVVYAVARDVTDLKLAISAATAAHAEAERANKAKSDFLASMSHELRTPLNAVLGFAQLLALEPLATDQQELVTQISSGGQILLELISEVLDIAKIEAGRLSLSTEPVHVDDILRRAVDLIRPLAVERSITLDLELTPLSQTHVLADRQRINQVLLNLLSNGVKYNRPQGRLTISCVPISTNTVRLSVRDAGPGIRPDKLAFLFQPFERLGAEQTAVGGAGLGLALSKGLIEAMGGQMGVESTLGEGSTFWIDLVSVPAPAVEPHSPLQIERDPRHTEAHGTVLYVEDNPVNIRLLERIFARRPNVRLLTTGDGGMAINLARESSPDLILLDLHLGQLSGEEILQRLQADPQTQHIPVAVLSGDAMPEQRKRLLASGAAAYLTKPFDVTHLLKFVDQTIISKPSERAQSALPQ